MLNVRSAVDKIWQLYILLPKRDPTPFTLSLVLKFFNFTYFLSYLPFASLSSP